MEKQIIKKCRWCGRKMRGTSESQLDYNIKKHEAVCLFIEEVKK